MSRRSMYFGTRDRMAWVACPAVERDSGAVGWSESGTYLNGGAFVARSKGAHRVHEMAWNMVSRKEAGKIESFASGVYGDGPYYWIDPMAADHNVLPTNWAYPAQELDTGVPLTDSTLGTFVATPTGNESLPLKSIQYVLPSGSVGKKLWVPIPPGHTLHFGAYGSTSGSGGVFATPYGRNGSVGARTPTQIADPSGNVWATSSWSGDVYSGVEFDVGSAGTPLRNLVTNPAFVTAAGSVQVRRNLFPNPRAIASGTQLIAAANNKPTTDPGWLTGLSGTPHGIPTAARIEAANPGTWWRVGHQGDAIKVQAGRTYTFSAWATINNPSIRVTVNVIWRNASGANIGEAPFDWRNISTWTRLSVTHTAPANADHVYVYVRGESNAGPVNAMAATGFMVDEWPSLRSYIDGTAPSADPDLENIWEGSPNASTSLARGQGVAGVTTNEVLAIKSSKFGGSIRLIPTGTNNSYIELTGAPVPLGTATALATLHLEAPIPGSLHTRALRLNMLSPFSESAASPNAAGSYPHRLTDNTHNTGRLLLRHGGAAGSGDVYWSNVMVTSGTYNGPYRDGNSPGWAWTGASNNSISTEVGAAVTLSGMVAQVLPNGRTPLATGWLDGLGTSGSEFEEFPERTDYSSIMDKVGLTATLVEVGTWL